MMSDKDFLEKFTWIRSFAKEKGFEMDIQLKAFHLKNETHHVYCNTLEEAYGFIKSLDFHENPSDYKIRKEER